MQQGYPSAPSRVTPRGTTLIQKLAWVYAAMFVFIVVLGYVPGVKDDQGLMFGLFSLQLHDDALHLGSGLWAAVAAWLSHRAATLYFKLFGVVYGLDGVLGLLTGQGYLDGGIFFHGITPLPLATRIGANIPHILIGGGAVLIGYVLSRRYAAEA